MDFQTFANSELLLEKLCRFVNQIVLIHREKFQICGEKNTWIFRDLQIQLITQIQILHDHAYLMVSVFPLSHHIQTQIDFCQGS